MVIVVFGVVVNAVAVIVVLVSVDDDDAIIDFGIGILPFRC